MKRILYLLFIFSIILFFSSCTVDSSSNDNPENNNSDKIIFGYVFSANDFTPIQGVNVTEKVSGTYSTTNSEGYYEIIPSSTINTYTIEFSKENLETEIIKINNNNNNRQKADIFMLPKLNGNSYYVSPNGSDNNNGSESSPWKTPGFASRRLTAGDKLIIKSGEYIIRTFDSDIIKPRSGNSENWIIIKAVDGVKIKGENNIINIVDLSESSYIKLENLEITNNNRAFVRDGISIADNNANNIILKDIYIHNIDEFGIDVQDVNRMILEYSSIKYCGFGAFGGPEGNYGGIRNLKIIFSNLSYSGHYYQGGDGSNRPYDRPDGFGIEVSQGPIEIYDTLVEHNYGDGIDSKSSNTYVHNCIVANNSCDGVKLWRGEGRIENTLIYGTGDGVGGDSPWAGIVLSSDRDGDKFYIINTTLHDNEERRAYPMYVQYDNNQKLNVTIYNSIFSGGFGHLWFRDNVNLNMKYNLIHIPSRDDQVYANGRTYSKDDINNGVLGEGNIFANPEFINPLWGKEGDFHLKDNSPAIDKGDRNNYPSEDLEHTKRPQTNGPDIGAYEK